MEFCPRCGSILVPSVSKGKSYLTCRKCGYKREATAKRGYVVREEVGKEKKEKLIVIEGAKEREKEKVEEERELLKEYYEIFLESMESGETE